MSDYDRSSRRNTPRSLNPGKGEPMRDSPTARVLIAKGITIMKFAEMLGISRVKTSEYMRGVRPWPRSTLIRAALVLEVEPKVLTGEMRIGTHDPVTTEDT